MVLLCSSNPQCSSVHRPPPHHSPIPVHQSLLTVLLQLGIAANTIAAYSDVALAVEYLGVMADAGFLVVVLAVELGVAEARDHVRFGIHSAVTQDAQAGHVQDLSQALELLMVRVVMMVIQLRVSYSSRMVPYFSCWQWWS